MELSGESIGTYIPYYLTQGDKDALVRALADFDSIVYYKRLDHPTALQGDGWSSLQLLKYETGEKKKVRGIILSNSCDIDPSNKRDIPGRLLFAPIIRLKSYGELLNQAGISKEKIASKFDSIRKQFVSTLFYLPVGEALDDEYIALLDDIHSIPQSVFLEEKERKKLFTLSLPGFYLFILKLSIHFCRFSDEGVTRN
jgi:hypothetical protein